MKSRQANKVLNHFIRQCEWSRGDCKKVWKWKQYRLSTLKRALARVSPEYTVSQWWVSLLNGEL